MGDYIRLMWRSLRTQLGLIFLAFFILVAGSVAATFWLVKAQHNDATIINLAGRQRMLTQQMTRLALTEPDSAELEEISQHFVQTLDALQDGGTALDANGRFVILPPTTNPAIRSQLDEASQTWIAFRQNLRSSGDREQLLIESNYLLSQLDQAVSAFEAEAQAKTMRLRQVQFTFLIAAFLLLGRGYFIIRRCLLQPLAALGKTAERIGSGNLSHPVPEIAGKELGQLAQTMEGMRREIAVAQEFLEQRVAQRTHELTAAFEFSQEIIHQLDLTPLLQSVAHRSRDLLGGQAASLCVLNQDGRFLDLVASSGTSEEQIGLRQPVQRGLALPVVQHGQTVAVKDGCANCGFLDQFPGNPCMAAPLQVGGQTLGALCVVRPDTPFDTEESRALTLLANAAAIAIDNAHLVSSSKKQAEANASLAERERLSAELHDNLAQTLSFLNLKIERVAELVSDSQASAAVDELGRMETAVKTAFTQVRTALTGLQQPLPDRDSFAQRLSSCVAEFRTGSPEVELAIHDPSALALPQVTQNQALHIVREALINVRRHAQASCVVVSVKCENGAAQFIVEDNGRGFDPGQMKSPHHLGLKIMRGRAERSGGQLTINTAPNSGTQIIASFPLK